MKTVEHFKHCEKRSEKRMQRSREEKREFLMKRKTYFVVDASRDPVTNLAVAAAAAGCDEVFDCHRCWLLEVHYCYCCRCSSDCASCYVAVSCWHSPKVMN